jgi:gluconate 5-dehydrogenase
MSDLTGKTALALGSGRGLGRGIAIAMAKAGARVATCSRTLEQAQQTAREISGEDQIKARGYRVDITSSTSVDSLVESVLSDFGALDILVCNAASNVLGTPLEISDDAWAKVLNTELTGYFYAARAAGRHMVKQRTGSIVMVSANSSEVGYDELVAVATAKGGVDMLARNLAVEWGRYNVRVNTINPGFTEHVPDDGADVTLGEGEDLEEEIRRATPMQRRGRIEEIAAPAVFLASDAASFITGMSIRVDGGYAVR